MMAGGGFRPVHIVAPLDDVEINFQNSFFGQLAFQLTGDHGLANFSQHRFFGREVEVFGELLRDGAPASVEFSFFDILHRRGFNPFPIESFM